MTESQAYVAFNLTDNIGSATVEKLSAEFGSVVAAWNAYPKKVSRTGGDVNWEAEYRLAEKFSVTILTPADHEYPKRLRETAGHPLALYVMGSVAALSKSAVALVGTRRATAYGKEIANHLAYDLSAAGWAVVSGLAEGIDAEAHAGALDAGGVTIGVLGSALDCFFPEVNRDLARKMVKNGGAVVSQFPFGHPPDQHTFPIRNHIVAALANGVVAVEAPHRSGTLITTAIAADLGRTVMAIPSRIDCRMSAGCLQLIRDGAILVRNADDVIEALSEFFPSSSLHSTTVANKDANDPEYTVEEAMVMLHVDHDGTSLDEISRLTKLPIMKVSSIAMTLRMKGFIRFLPGNRISLLTKRR